ncbi:hypothetical protein HBH95_095400 [Parastagonospora nodorum]|nr:hypothetical protein HBH95_095400 [Parastagonospora nodorum]
MSLSGIEGLPVELLQPIFFTSGYNVALLQASPRLAARLSSNYVYDATCRYYIMTTMLDRTVQTSAQTYIFASKWMTWAFFQSWITKTYALTGCLCGRTEGCFDAQWPPDFENATSMVFSRSHLPQFAFIKARLPRKLLCGPWTPDKIQFLRFLLWITSMTVDWSDTKTLQVAVEGRRQAMREYNLDAVELFNHNRRLGRGADLSTIRFAVMECGCDRSVVYDTISMANHWGKVRSWECAELDRWCEERISMGDPKGLWLQIELSLLRSNDWPVEQEEVDPASKTITKSWESNDEPQDRLIKTPHKWNEERRQFGWFYQEHGESKTGLHYLKRADLGDYWNYSTHSAHHVIRGLYSRGWPSQSFSMWMEMWIPDTKCQGASVCSCAEEGVDS